MSEKGIFQLENALLILGAGASCPYDFPSGAQLKEMIIKLLAEYQNHKNSTSSGQHTEFLKKIESLGYGLAFFEKFISHFKSSGAESIDEFLQSKIEDYSEHKKYVTLGQALIFYLISYKENIHTLAQKNDWIEIYLRYIFRNKERARKFCDKPPDVISFNYDNFFRAKMEYNLKNVYSKNDFPYSKITHVYGKTDLTSYQKAYSDNYINELTADLQNNLHDIKLIRPSDFDDDTKVTQIRNLIDQYDDIVLLGYGFNHINNKLLFKDADNFKSIVENKNIYSTSFFGDALLKEKIKSTSSKRAIFEIDNLKCFELIDSFIPRDLF